MIYLVVMTVAYLMGSLPTGFVWGKLKGVDIRTLGSGNIGATNVFRVLGTIPGTLVLLIDAAKGYLACTLLVHLAWLAFGSPANPHGSLRENLALAGGVLAIVGHNYTCWLNFKGGKGIATTAGVMLALLPMAFVLGLTVWLLLVLITRYVSVGSIAAAAFLPVATWATGGRGALIAVTGVLGGLAIYKHRGNLQRLRNGTENKIMLGKKRTSEEKSNV